MAKLLEIQKFQSIEVDHDTNIEGCIACANHFFVGRLCVTDVNGLKVYKMKDKVPAVLEQFDLDNTKFDHSDPR